MAGVTYRIESPGVVTVAELGWTLTEAETVELLADGETDALLVAEGAR